MLINCFFQYFDHKSLEKLLMEYKNQYEFIDIGTLGKSILGKNIPRITIGKGKKSVIYIGAHHGMEWKIGRAHV